ncbi:MAG: hypothetical protein AAF975_02905 [Spirochaetota bacterium]
MRRALCLCVLLLFPLGSVAAVPHKLLDTWVLRLEPQPWANGQYRYRVLSFWGNDTGASYLDFTIYPSASVRSSLLVGRIRQESETVLLFRPQREVRMVYDAAHQFPTPFRRKQRRFGEQGGEEQRRGFSLVESALKLGAGLTFDHYGSRFRAAQEARDAHEAMDLFFLNMYLLQSQVEDFGSVKMMKCADFSQKGLISGRMQLQFERRGLLGLGNSGLWFSLQQFGQVAKSRLQGRLFGGSVRMEGSLELFFQGRLQFMVDFSEVRIKHGYAYSGFYAVEFPQGTSYRIPVERYGH